MPIILPVEGNIRTLKYFTLFKQVTSEKEWSKKRSSITLQKAMSDLTKAFRRSKTSGIKVSTKAWKPMPYSIAKSRNPSFWASRKRHIMCGFHSEFVKTETYACSTLLTLLCTNVSQHAVFIPSKPGSVLLSASTLSLLCQQGSNNVHCCKCTGLSFGRKNLLDEGSSVKNVEISVVLKPLTNDTSSVRLRFALPELLATPIITETKHWPRRTGNGNHQILN